MKPGLPREMDKEILSTQIPGLMSEYHVEGVSVALIKNRKIVWALGFGVRNSRSLEPIIAQSVFEAYSLTKPLIAYRTLNLCRNGLLDLDCPLNKYLNTPYIVNDPRSQHITARTVLSHTSGLPDDETERRLIFNPGEQWSYSTQGYYFLQQVIDEITNESLDEHMKRYVLDPIGMASSSFVWDSRFESVMAQGHNLQGIPEDDRHIRVAEADSLFTTASDYGKFIISCIWPDQQDRNQSIHQISKWMLQPQIVVANGLCWGLGWGIVQTDDGDFLWHMGGGTGAPFQNFVLASESQGMGVVILTNSAKGGFLFEPLISLITGWDHSIFSFVQNYFYR